MALDVPAFEHACVVATNNLRRLDRALRVLPPGARPAEIARTAELNVDAVSALGELADLMVRIRPELEQVSKEPAASAERTK
jgi:hypothetical protein